MMTRIYLFTILFILTLVYAFCFTAIKIGLPFIPPLLFAGLRALVGGIVLLIIVSLTKQSILPKRHEWKWIVLVGITTTITFAGMFLSPGKTGVGIASILGNLSPLFTIFLASVVLHEKLSFHSILALLLSILGIVFISYPDFFGKNAYGIVGIILALAVSGGAAISNILIKQMNNEKIILRISAWQLIIGNLPLLIVSLFIERGSVAIWNITSFGILLFLGIFGTAFATASWYMLIQRYKVGTLSLFLFLIPVFGLAIASFVFKEALQMNELIGILIIIFAVVVLAIDSLNEHVILPQIR